VLLIAIISPALLGSEFKCVAVSNPKVATARIEQLEPRMPRVGDIMQATGSGNGTPPLQFAWDFGDGALAAGMQAAHVYVAPGSYRVTFTVSDAIGQVGRDSSQVDVSSRVTPSMPSLVLISNAVAGQPVLFAVLASEADASALTFIWTFSDGQSGTGREAIAIFPAAGMYLASVTTTNNFGAISTVQVPFLVVDAAH
jgi:PKD repeat protein